MNKQKRFDTYFKRLVLACIKRKLVLLPLGKTGQQVIWMAKSRGDVPGDGVLVAGGTHGDEVCGSLGILKFLETADDDLFKNKLAFIPIVSPIAFNAGRRNGYSGRTNCGYVSGMRDKLSDEGNVLNNNMRLLIKCSKAGFLSLHSTDHETGFFLYSYTLESVGPALLNVLDLRDEGGKYFKFVPDGTQILESNCDENEVRGGIVSFQFDGSLEHVLSLYGCPFSICSEMPGKASLEKRIQASVGIITKFIELRGGGEG